jgi:hypothetical protein
MSWTTSSRCNGKTTGATAAAKPGWMAQVRLSISEAINRWAILVSKDV